jgi:hypothetical protein
VQERGVAVARLQRDVEGRAHAGAAAALRGVAGSGIQRHLVGRVVEDRGVLLEDVLGSVPVMHVPIDDHHAIDRAGGAEHRGGNGDVVEETESHR